MTKHDKYFMFALLTIILAQHQSGWVQKVTLVISVIYFILCLTAPRNDD